MPMVKEVVVIAQEGGELTGETLDILEVLTLKQI